MEEHFILRAIVRFRPQFGWLPFLLLGGALATLAFSVHEAEWVSGDVKVWPLMFAGFILSAIIAQRKIAGPIAWLALILAGLFLAVFAVAELWPPGAIAEQGSAAVLDFWQIRLALLADRSAGWLATVRSGGRSTETIVFALGLAIAGWIVGVLVAWSAYRLRRPFLGLTLAGFALAANTFYGQTSLYWAIFFFGLAITAGTYLHHLNREVSWESRHIDFPSDVRTDILIYTAGISLGIMSLALAIPAINFRAIAEAFQRQEAIVAAEETMARAFAGVTQPRMDEGATGAGGMPRSFLLGGGPELAETVVMTATLHSDPGLDLSGFHWRSISFDVYTGRGWRRSPERETNIAAGETIPASGDMSASRTVTITQDVAWLYDRRASRYTIGRPAVFSHDLVALWRGLDDLVGVRGRNNASTRYSAQTSMVVSTPDQLRTARLADVPPEIRARYTALPDSLPDRVRNLAREVTTPGRDAAPLSPYDQARAIEQFLHQFAYSLDLPPPPAEGDIVDYFLFDLQTGFCDYFATAMVVMARSIGLPARIGVGFLQQPADASGIQTIRQLDAHSWAEVYFAGYGWVEFEPTPAFAISPPPSASQSDQPELQPTYAPPTGTTVAIPERAPQRETPWLWLLAAASAVLLSLRLWGRRLADRFAPRDPGLDGIQIAFAKLQEGAAALGYPPAANQTPAEFAAGLLSFPDIEREGASELRPAIERLTALFTARQYGGAVPAGSHDEANELLSRLRSPMRRLVWRRRFSRTD